MRAGFAVNQANQYRDLQLQIWYILFLTYVFKFVVKYTIDHTYHFILVIVLDV